MTGTAQLDPWLVAVVLGIYTAALFGIGFWARGRIHDHEDYLVAGRRLGMPLATATLFATWFGAGTLLVAADEVRAQGLRAAALDPLGAGFCLLIAGAFLAGPLWRMKLVTLVDFYRVRFGPRAELLGGLLMVPGYFGWIAAQFVALAQVLHWLFGIDPTLGLWIVAGVGMGYTLIGGLWSVVVTDALQAAILLVGLVVLAVAALAHLGGGDAALGWGRLLAETPPARLELIPREGLEPLLDWLALLAAGSLGNLPGQDLMQRIFASRSESVARRACFASGLLYLGFGAVPVCLGLAAGLIAPGSDQSILPVMAGLLLNPVLGLVFVLALVSAVLSTIDSAILAPAGVLSQNVFSRWRGMRVSKLGLDEWCVVGVTAASLAVAFAGENAFSILETAYELGLVSLLVPLVMGLVSPRGGEAAALASMGVGTALWGIHGLAGWDWFAEPWLYDAYGLTLPVGLTSAVGGLLAYAAARLR